MLGHRKIVGIAQAWRKETVLLSAGTLLSPSPWALLCATLRRAPDDIASLAALTISVQDCLGHPIDSRDWANDLSGALRRALGEAHHPPMGLRALSRQLRRLRTQRGHSLFKDGAVTVTMRHRGHPSASQPPSHCQSSAISTVTTKS